MVLDAAPAPAAGASGVPLGLLCPHVSRDDSPRSRLSRAGVHLCLQTLRTIPNTRLREGWDWAATGAMERWLDDTVRPPSVSSTRIVPLGGHPALWHDDAAWIKPHALIQAWLDSPGITFAGACAVASMRRDAGGWLLLDARGTCLAQADLVVVAAAGTSPALAGTATPDGPGFKPLQATHGQVSFGMQGGLDDSVLPPYPLNGRGHLVTQVPQPGGKAWYTGSTYETCEAGPTGGLTATTATGTQIADAHNANARRLNQLLQGIPSAATALASRFESGRVRHWRGTRYTPTDRLPVCGPLAQGEPGAAPSLWISCGLGSRGLSWAALCAELVAAQICGEPLPLPLGLVRLLGTQRLAVRKMAHNPDFLGKKGL
jgi:tRNA 5-methylaminomethyl-2-thiouridine biosynthesis bifunctional protein